MKKIYVFKFIDNRWQYINNHSVKDFSRNEKMYNDSYKTNDDTRFVLAENRTEAEYMVN